MYTRKEEIFVVFVDGQKNAVIATLNDDDENVFEIIDSKVRRK